MGCNFMMYPSSIGKSRAQTVTEALKELNELVEGSFVEDNARSIIQNNPEFFKSFSIVIATQLREQDAVALDAICRGFDIPVVYAKSYGLVGMVRNSVREHRVIESKPDNVVQDFRFGRPWPELAELVESVDLSGMESADHSHVPYGVILVKATLEYFRRHGVSEMPSSVPARNEYKEIIKSWQLVVDGCPIPEENFEEALANLNKVWGPRTVPSDVLRILSDVESTEAGKDSEPFWIVCSALKQFYDKEDALPVCPTIPDMHSTTASYLALQRVYRAKFDEEVARVCEMARAINPHVPNEFVRKMCLNARVLRVVRPKPVYRVQELELTPRLKEMIVSEGDRYSAAILFFLRYADGFFEEHGRYPGAGESADMEEDARLISMVLANVPGINEDMIHEMVRSGGAELHCIASILGAMASQEAIKLLTHQMVPLGGTLIYDGIHSLSHVVDTY
jgi:amyloid beta precursor protein binding protein 1